MGWIYSTEENREWMSNRRNACNDYDDAILDNRDPDEPQPPEIPLHSDRFSDTFKKFQARK